MRSYDLTELEEISALSRRTISDYVSRGLLAGPSHRGRGARYSQRDLDALRVIPRLRTVLKPEFPSLNSVREFLATLNVADLRHLVRITNERAFEIEVRRIRVQQRLKTFLPAVSPEQLREALSALTPEQVCAVDRGQIQIGSLLNIEALTAPVNGHGHGKEYGSELGSGPRLVNGNGNGNGNAGRHETGELADRYERFGNSTVQVRIEKAALQKGRSNGGLSEAIHEFAHQIESILKASS